MSNIAARPLPGAARPWRRRRSDRALSLSALACLLSALVAVAAGCGAKPAPTASPGMSPEARLVGEMRDVLGGEAAWAKTVVIRFDLTERAGDTVVTRRSLDYDRGTGAITITWAAPGAETAKVTWLESAGINQATVARGSVPMRDDQTIAELRAQAWEYFLNDLYMTFAGYRLASDGGALTYYGLEEKQPDGRTGPAYLKLAVRNAPNVTLRRDYVFQIDPKKKIIGRWTEMTDSGPVMWRASEWKQAGPAIVPRKHHEEGGDRSYEITKIRIDTGGK
jgi:hypothetical protein